VTEIAQCIETLVPESTLRYTEQDFREHFTFEVESGRSRSLGWEPKTGLVEGLQEIVTGFPGVEQPVLRREDEEEV